MFKILIKPFHTKPLSYIDEHRIAGIHSTLQECLTAMSADFMTTDFSVWDLRQSYVIDPAEFQSQGRSTPFTGWRVTGKCMATVCDSKLVWLEKVRNSR